MTEQFLDSCIFEGRKLTVEHWAGDTSCIPTNEQLGLRTVSPHTANWSGRIDHFMIHYDQLRLFKIEATLSPEDRDIHTKASRREITFRYEPMEVTDALGTRDEIKEYRFDYFIFDHLIIPFTGSLRLGFPFEDIWESPLPPDDESFKLKERLVLEFLDGELIDVLAIPIE
jgi:hypothetical protein